MTDFGEKDGKKTAAYILISVAAFIVLARTGILDFIGISSLIGWIFETFWRLVPAGILVLGLMWLKRSEGGEKPIVAWFVTLFGLILLISQFDLFGLSFGDMFLPMWLVVIAFMLMNPRKILPSFLNTPGDEIDENSEKIKLVAFMGGGELDYTSQNLHGGEVAAVWGGYDIDFTDADMEGDSMELNLLCVMGGVEITIPPNWDVEKRNAVCIMGGFSNKTKCIAEKLELPRKTLIISGLALMGGGEIKN